MIGTIDKQQLKEKIRDLLRRVRFPGPGEVIDVSDGDDIDDLHVVVVSPQFAGRGLQERTNLIWTVLFDALTPEEWGYVSLTIGVSPEQVNGATIQDIKTM